ncbi:HAD-IIIA family hydrolase [Pendulispora rubella]|uniref:D,D-heptose 1,7-bisphosphate phosphatase n=2 Tax=Pendulispora rubella TaxID=2741070 RepID=A0ABZ2L1J6_9BACT
MGVGKVNLRRGVILDRDGTLIDVVRDEETGAITTAFHPSHLRLLAGVEEGLRLLHDAGYVLAIATNQPGPAKGHFGRAAVERTNDALVTMLADRGIPIAKVATCMHHPDGGAGGDASLVGPCPCRKPKPGLLLDLMQELALDPAQSWMLGDTSSDVEAGHAAGLRAGLIFAPNRCELCPLRPPHGMTASTRRPPDLAGATVRDLALKIANTP